MSENPLGQYFRQPAIHLELPSKGNFYPDGVLTLPSTGELPILPMTAIDEITYKTPDALFNGSAVVDVIKSCAPLITDPWQMPTVDINTVLTAIRIATLGHEMDIEATCPKCSEIADYSIDLRILIDQAPDASLYEKPLPIGDLQIFFKPLLYVDVNKNNKIQFEEQKLSQILGDSDIEAEQKIKLLSEAFTKIAKFSIDAIAKSVSAITTPDNTVSDPEHIREFLNNCESDVYEVIKKRLFELKSIEDTDPLHITCSNEECKHEFEQIFTLDMTSFFGRNS